MKLFVLSALLMLTAVNARASEDMSFMLAMDYSDYLRVAQNDTIGAAKKAISENPYAVKKVVIEQKTSVDDDEKWNTIKEFNSKQRTLSGGGFVNTNDRVAVGAFANYQYDDIDESRLNEAYSLKINVNIAL